MGLFAFSPLYYGEMALYAPLIRNLVDTAAIGEGPRRASGDEKGLEGEPRE